MDSLNTLEWPQLIVLTQEQARTEPGKARLDDLLSSENWAQSLAEAQDWQKETQEISMLLDRESLWSPLLDLQDPFSCLEALEKGVVLEVGRLALLRRWLLAIDSWQAAPREEFGDGRFRQSLGSLTDPREPLKILDKTLTPEGELSERASPKLASLFSEIRSLKKEITNKMDSLVNKYNDQGILQQKFSDVHDGRYVIPVKISDQGALSGIIYGTSSSRQTVFIEPAEIAPYNNRLKQKENELEVEIFAVLEATSKSLHPFIDDIGVACDIVSHWDWVQAKARIARHYSGKTLDITQENRFKLRNTAHPLLWWSIPHEQITKNDIEFGDPAHTLLLTGPNTGGKTVLLKTLGLAGICARAGFPFPGSEGQSVPYFDSFFIDVGDSQSIELHLSSFSGHIARFKSILEGLTSHSLVLLDELNTATDPGEGAALGRAFLETLMGQGAMIVATTHDPLLKALALNDARILNASMMFNESTRSPTYELRVGVPGRSRALETAERLGLPTTIIDLAKTYLTQEHQRFEKLIEKLEKDSESVEKLRREAQHLKDEAEKLKKEWTERTEKNMSDLYDRIRQKLRSTLEQAQDEIRNKVRKMDELKTRKSVDEARSDINRTFEDSIERVESTLKEEAPELARTLEKQKPIVDKEITFEVGETVRVPKWKSLGLILAMQNNKASVQMGALQIQMSLSDLQKASENELRASGLLHHKKQKSNAMVDKPSPPPSQIDLRGKRFEDAMSELESYLDLAFRSQALFEVTVIHGLGTGALREGARELFKKIPYIKETRDGGLGSGGAGATIVVFDH